jgi:Anaerobic C4-dicarboxylate transporter
MSISVIASQQAITASPISAAMAAMVALLAPFNISMLTIMSICIPATLCGVFLGSVYCSRVGVELKDDPEYQRRLAEGMITLRKTSPKPRTWKRLRKQNARSGYS